MVLGDGWAAAIFRANSRFDPALHRGHRTALTRGVVIGVWSNRFRRPRTSTVPATSRRRRDARRRPREASTDRASHPLSGPRTVLRLRRTGGRRGRPRAPTLVQLLGPRSRAIGERRHDHRGRPDRPAAVRRGRRRGYVAGRVRARSIPVSGLGGRRPWRRFRTRLADRASLPIGRFRSGFPADGRVHIFGRRLECR